MCDAADPLRFGTESAFDWSRWRDIDGFSSCEMSDDEPRQSE